MSTAAAFSSDVIERDLSSGAQAQRDKDDWISRWPSLEALGNQVTSITLIEDRKDWLVKAHKRLAELASLQKDWDSYEADAPNSASIELTRHIIGQLAANDFEPSRIDPSAEGGICLSFQRGRRYADVECFNSGELLAVTSLGGDETEVWDVGDIDQGLSGSLDKLRAFLGR